MSISYIPEDTFAVCTFQMSPKPQKLKITRSKDSVNHKDKKKLLTIEDKNIGVQFTCKSPVNIASSFLAFGAGLIVGALLLSNPIGWLVAGSLVLAVGAAYTAAKVINHKCTSPMKAGNWMLYKSTVTFNGHNAITQMSMLSCGSGGILKPFFSYSLACSAAKNISNNNRTEVGINVGISFFAGLLAPLGITKTIGKYGMVKGIGYIAGTNIAGLGVTWTLQYGQKEWIRSDNDYDDNEIYQAMNDEVDNNSLIGQIDEPSDLNDADALSSLARAVKEGDIAITNQKLKNDLSKLEGLSNYKLKKSKLAQQIVKDLNDGKYGADTKSQIQSKYSNRIGNTQRTVNVGRQVAGKNFKLALKRMGSNAGQGALFFLPFVATYFSENARKDFADEALKDMIRGTSVTTKNPLE